MNRNKIYQLFLKTLENEKNNSIEDGKFNLLLSFENLSKREQFIQIHQDLDILKKFEIIPTIRLKLTKIEINNLQKDDLIFRIEEDQKLYLSILDVINIIGINKFNRYRKTYTGKNIIIGIIDNGINQNFESLSGTIIQKYLLNETPTKKDIINKTTETNHGSLMANIIGSQFVDEDNNPIGIAPDAKIIDFNILNLKEEYFFTDVLDIFDFLIKKKIVPDIILLPLSTIEPSDGNDILSLACNLLVEKGIIIVCPAGNFGPESYTIGSPAAAEKVITVGSMTKEKSIADYSGRGPTLDERIKPDFCLPSSKVQIPLSNDLTVTFSGTSIAAALTTGLIALVKQYNPNFTYIEIINIFKNASIELKNCAKNSQGFGTVEVINIFNQLNAYPKQQNLRSYQELIKSSLIASLKFFLIMIIIYLIFYFFNIIQMIFNLIL